MTDNDVATVRKVRVFSWSPVDPQLTRSLLSTPYRVRGKLEHGEPLDRLPDERLAEQGEY